MKLRVILLAVVLGGWLAGQGDRALNGKVVDATTGEPVAHAHITIRFFAAGQSQSPEVSVLSDGQGAFQVTHLPTGGYQISCEKPGYLTSNQPPMNAGGASATGTITLKLTAQAAIEGTVLDDQDQPMANTFVQMVRQTVVEGRRQTVIAGAGGSDETGYFRLYNLPAGHYFISIAPRLDAARRARPLAYPQFFYPNAPDLAAAQAIDLKAGDDRQIKIRVPDPVPAFTLSGAVAAAGSTVTLELNRQSLNQPLYPMNVDAHWDGKSGTFRISHVTPGSYVLTARVMEQGAMRVASLIVTVGSADVTGIRLDPAEIALEGTVRTDGDAGQRVVNFVSLNGERSGQGGQVGADGKFRISNLAPDTYRVRPQIGNQQWCVRSILQGGRDVRDGLTIAPGSTPEPLDIVVTSHCGAIDVTFSDSNLPPNLAIMLLRKQGEQYAMEKQGFVSMRAGDTTPHGTLQGIPAGDYTLFVWPADAPIEYANADYMRQYDSYGVPVTVSDDSHQSVTVDKVLQPSN